jgi:hypothetical protein
VIITRERNSKTLLSRARNFSLSDLFYQDASRRKESLRKTTEGEIVSELEATATGKHPH